MIDSAWNPQTYFLNFLRESRDQLPISIAMKQRNTLLDTLFYDVGSLTESEFEFLVEETNLEGSILVIYPSSEGSKRGVEKFSDYKKLRAAPGELLSHFSVAGVGSSDVGAAALARNLADHIGEPVGAIVAGYGVADVLAEALGGWFFLGSANRLMKSFHDKEAETAATLERYQGAIKGLDVAKASEITTTVTGSPDSDTLLQLLLDEDREIQTLLGHSKGCLSIAYALQALGVSGVKTAQEKAKAAKIITTGAVVEMPHGFDNTAQFLGAIDWFGGMNSRFNVDHIEVPNAWHHLNTRIPFHMSVRDILRQADK